MCSNATDGHGTVGGTTKHRNRIGDYRETRTSGSVVSDVGGKLGRKICFYTDTGEVS